MTGPRARAASPSRAAAACRHPRSGKISRFLSRDNGSPWKKRLARLSDGPVFFSLLALACCWPKRTAPVVSGDIRFFPSWCVCVSACSSADAQTLARIFSTRWQRIPQRDLAFFARSHIFGLYIDSTPCFLPMLAGLARCCAIPVFFITAVVMIVTVERCRRSRCADFLPARLVWPSSSCAVAWNSSTPGSRTDRCAAGTAWQAVVAAAAVSRG